jgi:predicted transcriptional regulator YheO
MFASTVSAFNGQGKVETFASSITETIEALFEQAVAKVGKQPASMSTDEKIELVKEMELSGVFQIKGAVDQVALFMGVSKYTIYNYLKKIHTEQDINPI